MEIFIIWFVGAVFAGIIASSKGRSGFGYFLLSVLLTPLLGLILAIGMPSLANAAGKAVEDAPTPLTHVKCPDCRELVQKDARKCKHCGTTLIPECDMTEEQLMKKYGINKNGTIYHVNGKKFDNLDKAIIQACRS